MVFKTYKKIKTGVVFDKKSKTIYPKWFEEDGNYRKIEKIAYKWEEKDGLNTFIHFSVLSEGVYYELVYDAKKIIWFISSIENEI